MPTQNQSLPNKCGLLSQVDRLHKAHASKNFIGVSEIQNKWGHKITTSK
jgi:hypothetical protein